MYIKLWKKREMKYNLDLFKFGACSWNILYTFLSRPYQHLTSGTGTLVSFVTLDFWILRLEFKILYPEDGSQVSHSIMICSFEKLGMRFVLEMRSADRRFWDSLTWFIWRYDWTIVQVHKVKMHAIKSLVFIKWGWQDSLKFRLQFGLVDYELWFNHVFLFFQILIWKFNTSIGT